MDDTAGAAGVGLGWTHFAAVAGGALHARFTMEMAQPTELTSKHVARSRVALTMYLWGCCEAPDRWDYSHLRHLLARRRGGHLYAAELFLLNSLILREGVGGDTPLFEWVHLPRERHTLHPQGPHWQRCQDTHCCCSKGRC